MTAQELRRLAKIWELPNEVMAITMRKISAKFRPTFALALGSRFGS